jgi:Phage tail sheath C-terminal domain/Phage tail sheath protein subtilisin-like domain
MATLVSPGVSVTVSDESVYASAGAGTVPLIMIATAANKLAPGSTTTYAPGTLAANANQLYLISSQRDLLQTFGVPTFYNIAGTPDYGNQLNELGLFTAYQYLGIANTAYVLRANIDLSQMVPSTTEPAGAPSLNQYWLNSALSTWGIFASNGNVNSANAWTAETPIVLTNDSHLERIVQSDFIATSASAPIITRNANLVINGTTVALSIGMTLSTVASTINSNTTISQAGITAIIYARTGKPDVTMATIDDMYYLRLKCTNIDTAIDLLSSNSYILADLGFATPEPNNVILPNGTFGSVGNYAVDAYSTNPYDGLKKNGIWQKIEQTTLDGTTAAWWFKVGSVDTSYPGWGWREAMPRVIKGTVANPTFTAGNQCTISIGDSIPVTITLSGTTLSSFVSSINSVLDANSFNAYASIVTSGSSNYLVITNYDGTDTAFADITLEADTTHPWQNAGMPVTQTYYGSVTGAVANPTFVAATTYVASAVTVAPGTGYVPGDSLNVVGGTHSVVGVLSVASVRAVTAVVAAGGTGYNLNDTLTFSGTNYTSPLVLTVSGVSGGAITSVSITAAGQRTGSIPSNPVSPTSTSGSGINANFTLGWGVNTVTVSDQGNYTVNPTNPVTVTGGSGTNATFTVTMGFLTANTFSIDPGTGNPVTIYVPASPNNTLAGVVSAVNAAFPAGPIVASVATGNYLTLTNTNNTQFTIKDISGTPLNSAGIKNGYVFGRQLVYQGYYPSLTVPSTLPQTAATNVWINTTSQDRGTNLVVSKYNGSLWIQENIVPNTGTIPLYSSDSVANAAFGALRAIGTIYARYNNDGDSPAEANTVLYYWDGSSWQPLTYTAKATAPVGPPANGTLWYNTYLQVDIMVGNGMIWQGYRNAYPATDPNGPIIDGSMPTTQSDGSPLVTNDIWVDSSVKPYPVLYRYDASTNAFSLIDNTNHTSPSGIIFTDARWNNDGYVDGSQAPSAMVVSNYVDSDAPNAELYPAGMLLFNTRYSTYNVKEYVVNYFPTLSAPYDTDAWVTASGNAPDGTPYMGSHAQRAMVVKALNSSIVSNESIRGEAVYYNLMATPGYIECLADMVLLNDQRQNTFFVVADPPGTLPADTTSLQNWATNANNTYADGEAGLITHSSYAAVYYPWALESNLDGNNVFVPPSVMALTTYAYNDQVAYPWFAPAGFNRGLVQGALSVGYLKADGTYQPVTLNQGQRDVLYVNSINPISFIPNRGLVIFGQKTLDPITTLLDRVNVARLVNYLSYNLNTLAQPFLFEPNDQQTRQAVTAAFNSFMGNLVGLRALYDYSVVCDTSNNTPARISANELWIDIAIQPEVAIEFIYIPIRVLSLTQPLPGGANAVPTV